MMKRILFLISIIVIITSSFVSADAINNQDFTKNEIKINQNYKGYINITAVEAWELMNNTEDGRQIPIDIRRFDEYISERIITPNSADRPRWFPYELTSDGPGPIKNEGFLLEIFMKIYSNKNIILYCRTGRRTGIAAQILVDHGFTGTIYNMVNGITEWKIEGLPTVEGIGI
jgi:rhodanese-related sulfurtransferase